MTDVADRLGIVILDPDPFTQGRLTMELMRFGHRCVGARFTAVAASMLGAPTADALVCVTGPDRPTLAECAALLEPFPLPRRIALAAILIAPGMGDERQALQLGFDVVGTFPIPPHQLDFLLRDEVARRRPPTVLDVAVRAAARAEGGTRALDRLDRVVADAQARLRAALEVGGMDVVPAAQYLADACRDAGLPAAALEADRLAEEPLRPYLRRALGNALAAAEAAIAAARTRRDGDEANPTNDHPPPESPPR